MVLLGDVAAAKAITATFALQQALPAALSGDADSLADGLSRYRPGTPMSQFSHPTPSERG